MCVARGPFIDQTQSMNLFFDTPKRDLLIKAAVYGWKNGLKTGSYYIRSNPKKDAVQFSLDADFIKQLVMEEKEEECVMCSG